MANQGQGGSDFAHNFLRTVAKFTEEAGAASAANKSARLGLIDYEYDPTDFLGGVNPRIIFDGETLASQKRYTVMPPYYPIPGQRVCLIPVGTTYLIIGSVDVVPQDPKVDIFTVTDTWEKPTGARMVRVQVQAGGGAGGGAPATSNANTQTSVGAGAAGGGYGETWFSANSLDASYTVTVGTGGAGVSGTTGGSGTSSSFGSLVTATGGNGAGSTAAVTVNTGVNGADSTGQTVVGDMTVKGGGGGSAMALAARGAISGVGGSSQLGNGGRGKAISTGSAAGDLGQGYGGGGSGGVNGPGTGGVGNAAVAGGDGASGVVIVTTYF